MEDFTEEDLRKHLLRYPSSFEILPKHIGRVGLEGKVQTLINKLTDDQHSTSKSKSENLKINNFLSYLHFIMMNYKVANDYCEESLSLDPDNIIALSNKAHFLLETGQSTSDVETCIMKLDKLNTSEKFATQKCFAEAELAYCYGRMGPFNHQRAVDLYRKVIKECPVTDYSWKFGLALALVRQMHMFISRATDKYNPLSKLQEALDLLYEVVMNTEHTDKVLCAMAWTELGQTISTYSRYKSQVVLLSPISKLSEREMFHKAHTIAPNEPFVLEHYGRYLRICNELDMSEKLLRQAISIKPTCFAYHHLALTLKRRVKTPKPLNFSVSRGKFRKHNQSSLSKMVKCPTDVEKFPGNKLLSEAIQLLQQALKIDNTALWMYYEISLIYRMLDDLENAIVVLKKIIAMKDILPTPELSMNVYEQLGICLLEISQSDSFTPEEQARFHRDGKMKLQNAVEKQSEIVEKDQEFRSVWKSFSTLKQLLESSPQPEKLSRKLATLHRLMGYDEEAISLYKRAAKQDHLTSDDYQKWLQSHLKRQEYNQASELLGTLKCTSEITKIPKQLCINVFSEGAFDAYASGDLALASQRFQNAFDISCGNGKPGLLSKTLMEEVFDTHILHSCGKSKCSIPYGLCDLIKQYTGLKCTINEDDCTLGSFKLQALVEIMEKCSCIIILTHNNNNCNKNHIEHALRISQTTGGGKVVTVADSPNNIPAIAKTKPFLNYPSSESQVAPIGENIPEVHKNWLKELLSKML